MTIQDYDPNDDSLKKLAMAIFMTAVADLKRAETDYERRLLRRFFTRWSWWHFVLDLRPEAAEKWLRSQVEGGETNALSGKGGDRRC